MAGLQKFQIEVNATEDIFLPGETISGNVVLELGRPKSVRGIKLRFKGKGEVCWSESDSPGDVNRSTTYSAHEEYFRRDLILLGRADGSENVEIASGCHVFPFNFTLPPNIPNSFEHHHGHIRYSIKAIIDRPWKFDHETSSHFTVAAPFDLAQDPTSNMAIDDDEVTSFCCIACFDPGLVNVHIHIPRSGFAVGETIKSRIAINNSSSVDVECIKIKLRQKIKLHATTRSRTESEIVAKVKQTGPFRKKDEIVIGLQVPSVPSSNFLHTNLVDIDYTLRFEFNYSGCHCSTNREIPILIGERLNQDRNLQPEAISYGFPNSFPSGTFQPNAPSGSGFGNGNRPPYPVPADQTFSKNGYDKNGPYPSNPIPPYGFVPNQPSAPSEGLGVTPYPPPRNSSLGFVNPLTTESTSTTETAPPSYDDCLEKSKHPF